MIRDEDGQRLMSDEEWQRRRKVEVELSREKGGACWRSVAADVADQWERCACREMLDCQRCAM